MMADPFVEFKAKQRDGWKHFTPLEMLTTTTAAHLVRFAGVRSGQRVLDVGCGTGVVAITARREGAKVTGIDLTPELLARAKQHGGVAGFEDVAWREGDVEDLPFGDAEFDVVLSQFGHMFAPRPELAVQQMLRVLKPGGTVAFSTWPPELMIGKVFALVGSLVPAPPGAAPPPQWGDPATVTQRLGDAVRELTFDRGTMLFPALSPGHYREGFEATAGPVIKLVQALASEPSKLASFRRQFEGIVAPYFDPARNVVRQDYLVTRAVKV